MRRPKGTLTPAQRQFAVSHAGDMTVPQIAKRLKVSPANVKRSCRDVRFHSKNGKWKYRPDLVRQILEYYFEHGAPATKEAFPGVSIKSIVDRPEYYGIPRLYRQTRWTQEQHLEAVRMAGLVSMEAQARFFGRPGAHAGSVKAFWVKRVKAPGGQIHGLSDWNAKHLVTDDCPRIRVRWGNQRIQSGNGEKRPLVLWIDAEKHLRPGSPEFLKAAIIAMADFTRKLFGSKNPKPKIMKMIRDREAAR